jgi:DNA repair exonuclease SbcCD ATPase subunit
MKVELKQMTLTNFKGVEFRTIEFGHDTLIRGTNGTGKTTVVDAYNWCLYGKNSQGKTVVGEIKRRDENCQVVHNLEYSVELVFDIDGVEKKYKRLVTEKWTKPKGAPEKILTGHEVTYFVNDLQCSTKKEYDTQVSEIASQDVLRIMTEIGYFFTLKDEEQKQHLLRLAFGTDSTDEANEIATGIVVKDNAKMVEFVANLKGEKADSFRKNVRSKINALDKELQTIPKEIAAKQETMPPDDDWAMIEAKINFKKDEIAKIEARLNSDNGDELAIAEAEKGVSETKLAIAKRTEELTKERQSKDKPILDKIAQLQQTVTTNQMLVAHQLPELEATKTKLKGLLDTREKLVDQWHAIKENRIEFTPEELVCPTCKRPYDVASLTQGKLNENVAKGKAVKVEIEQQSERVTLLEKSIAEHKANIETAISELSHINPPSEKLLDVILDTDETLVSLRKQQTAYITKLVNLKNGLNKTQQDNELLSKKTILYSELENLISRKSAKDVRDNVANQITALKEKQRKITQEIAELEQMEADAIEFIKLRDNSIAYEVNKLFSMVTFDFVSDQLNGVDKIACNCYVDGMPYADRNNAGKVNAGLDVINAFSKHEGITLPIFVDNAESVVSYLATDSQKILLAVDGSINELKIENL